MERVGSWDNNFFIDQRDFMKPFIVQQILGIQKATEIASLIDFAYVVAIHEVDTDKLHTETIFNEYHFFKCVWYALVLQK